MHVYWRLGPWECGNIRRPPPPSKNTDNKIVDSLLHIYQSSFWPPAPLPPPGCNQSWTPATVAADCSGSDCCDGAQRHWRDSLSTHPATVMQRRLLWQPMVVPRLLLWRWDGDRGTTPWWSHRAEASTFLKDQGVTTATTTDIMWLRYDAVSLAILFFHIRTPITLSCHYHLSFLIA